MQDKQTAKEKVKKFWNDDTCGTVEIDKEKFTKEYFDEIERIRYSREPEVKEFAQFHEGRGKKLLEVGVGAATDFCNWLRNGAKAHGIDLTPSAIEHARHRVELEGLEAEELRVADCENLPFEDESFEMVYSWGVIHHTPDTPKAAKEIIRVLKPGGKAKIMVYNRKSVLAVMFWIKHALLRGRPGMTINEVLNNHMESFGTKGYTPDEIREMLAGQPIKNLEVDTITTYYDRAERFGLPQRTVSKILRAVMDKKNSGWFLTFTFEKA
ncbi:MAG: hypothetical protein Kapaf2KO_10000 [Candidatus Kapaibacteriales bacterium]